MVALIGVVAGLLVTVYVVVGWVEARMTGAYPSRLKTLMIGYRRSLPWRIQIVILSLVVAAAIVAASLELQPK